MNCCCIALVGRPLRCIIGAIAGLNIHHNYRPVGNESVDGVIILGINTHTHTPFVRLHPLSIKLDPVAAVRACGGNVLLENKSQ